MDIAKNLSYNLSELMGRKGIMQNEMAEVCNVSQIFISYVINGHKVPSVEVLKKMADRLGTTIDALISEPKKGKR